MSDFPDPGARRRTTVAARPDHPEASVSSSERYADGGPGKWDTIKRAKGVPAGATTQALRAIAEADTMDEAVEFVAGFNEQFKAQQEAAQAATFSGNHAVAVYPGGYVSDPIADRPHRKHANAKHEKPARRFDQSALHGDVHGTLIGHADYQAHQEKYDYVWRSIQKGDRVLDVGCGTDLPLLTAINRSLSQATKVMLREGGCYVGVDLNNLKTTTISWATLLGGTDLTSDEGYQDALDAIPDNAGADEPRGYTLVVALEIIEHMEVDDGRRLLENIRDLMSPDGRLILSTPVYDGRAMARNHIHEYYVDELRELVESVGLRVERRMGTFTSEPVIKPWLKQNRPDWYSLYMEAREFHSSGYMSGLMAPMFPDLSRNNILVIRRTA